MMESVNFVSSCQTDGPDKERNVSALMPATQTFNAASCFSILTLFTWMSAVKRLCLLFSECFLPLFSASCGPSPSVPPFWCVPSHCGPVMRPRPSPWPLPFSDPEAVYP